MTNNVPPDRGISSGIINAIEMTIRLIKNNRLSIMSPFMSARKQGVVRTLASTFKQLLNNIQMSRHSQ